MMMYGGRDAATDEAARRPSVVRQADVDHGLPSVIVLRITLMSLPPSPVCVCCGLPQPRSRSALAADTRAAAGAAFEPQMPVSVRMASSVCARAKDRISAVAFVI